MQKDVRYKIEEYAKHVNEYLVRSLEGRPSELYNASSYYIRTGGKRLRPIMTITSCQMFGGIENDAMPAAASVELIHNFSLVHDDIMDNDDLRHSTPTVHTKFGIPLAILSGDILFSKAFQILSINNNNSIKESSLLNMVRRLSSACVEICEGQSLDIDMAKNKNFPSEKQYINMISKKTAALFEVSCSLGALSSRIATENDVNNMAIFGKNVGIAFQLIDDLIGIIGDPKNTGKAVGNDIREGKKTYPILYALENSDKRVRQDIIKIFGKKDTNNEDLKKIVYEISSLEIEKVVREIASKYVDVAEDAIKTYEDTDFKNLLKETSYFIVKRVN
ncbi:MAG: polyprenyl synthetase family protein [Nitrososphaeraceae archaeon]